MRSSSGWIALAAIAFAVAEFSPAANAQMRADGHAPIGVMGDHMHKKGGWMLSYRYMFMNMNGNRDGTDRLGTDAVNAEFPVAPFDMDMQMHMLGLMWGPSDRLTLTAMAPFIRLDMKHRTRMGTGFETETSHLGDISLTAMVRLADWTGSAFGTEVRHHAHVNLGVSLPTGSIDLKDDTPMGRVRLPYPMQIGSGTYDLLPGLVYTARTERYSFGAQARANFRTGTNSKGYRLGHRMGATAWFARQWARAFSTSLRFDYQDWGDIRGDDDALNPNLVPTADPDRRGGRRLDVLVGANWMFTKEPLRGHRLAAEVGRPVYQDLNGPQLEVDWTATVGWKFAF